MEIYFEVFGMIGILLIIGFVAGIVGIPLIFCWIGDLVKEWKGFNGNSSYKQVTITYDQFLKFYYITPDNWIVNINQYSGDIRGLQYKSLKECLHPQRERLIFWSDYDEYRIKLSFIDFLKFKRFAKENQKNKKVKKEIQATQEFLKCIQRDINRSNEELTQKLKEGKF